MTFAPFLHRLEDALGIPYPERREVMAEVADHLQALFDDLTAAGVAPGEAYDRAVETLGVDQAFLASMGEVHGSLVARALARLPRRVSLGLEFTLITATGLAMAATVAQQEATMVEFMQNGGFFMIPINLAGLAILLLGLERIWSLFIKKDHSVANLGRRLLSLGFLGALTALTGLIGTALGFFEAFSAVDRLPVPFPIFEVCRIALTTTIWGMTLSLMALVFYFVTKAKGDRIREQRLA